MTENQKERTRAMSSRPFRAAVVAALALLGAMAVLGAASPAMAHSATPSCSVTVHTENLADNAIQSAINAYPGGVICVGPGTFPEQLVIAASGTTLRGAGPTQTVIEPGEPLALNTYDYDAGPTASAAIILVEGASGDPTTGVSGVTIENLEVNGLAGQSSFTSCANDYFGVDFQASSGTLTDANVLNIAMPTSPENLFGCQDGQAVYAYNGYFNYAGTNNQPDAVTISHSTISGFDKTGILCDDPGESCLLSSNTIVGIGATPYIASNGVQIGYGALGTLQSNKVSASGIYTGAEGCTGDAQGYNLICTENEGAGILLYDSASGTVVTQNTLCQNEYGIDYYDDGTNAYWSPATTSITHNVVDSSVAYGIVAEGAPGAVDTVTIHSNTVDNQKSLDNSIWGAPGILVDTGTFVVTQNKIEGTSVQTGSSNGASQAVCGPTGVFYVCTPQVEIVSAAIQGTSESGGSLTFLQLEGNSYTNVSHRLATIGVLGGSVNVVET